MRPLLTIVLLSALCQGCFVFDELDKGEEIMRQHRPKNIDEAAPEPAPDRSTKDAEPAGALAFVTGLADRVMGWWSDLRDPAPAERAVDDVVVRCELPERTQFTRKSDCIVRGGRVL